MFRRPAATPTSSWPILTTTAGAQCGGRLTRRPKACSTTCWPSSPTDWPDWPKPRRTSSATPSSSPWTTRRLSWSLSKGTAGTCRWSGRPSKRSARVPQRAASSWPGSARHWRLFPRGPRPDRYRRAKGGRFGSALLRDGRPASSAESSRPSSTRRWVGPNRGTGGARL